MLLGPGLNDHDSEIWEVLYIEHLDLPERRIDGFIQCDWCSKNGAKDPCFQALVKCIEWPTKMCGIDLRFARNEDWMYSIPPCRITARSSQQEPYQISPWFMLSDTTVSLLSPCDFQLNLFYLLITDPHLSSLNHLLHDRPILVASYAPSDPPRSPLTSVSCARCRLLCYHWIPTSGDLCYS